MHDHSLEYNLISHPGVCLHLRVVEEQCFKGIRLISEGHSFLYLCLCLNMYIITLCYSLVLNYYAQAYILQLLGIV